MNKQLLQDKMIAELWLSHAAFTISEAGGLISVDRLRNMSLEKFANICGRNGLKLISTHEPIIKAFELVELLKYGLEGGPKGDKE